MAGNSLGTHHVAVVDLLDIGPAVLLCGRRRLALGSLAAAAAADEPTCHREYRENDDRPNSDPSHVIPYPSSR